MGVKGVDEMKQKEYREAAINAVKKLSKAVGIPKTLKEIGVKKEDLEALTDAAMADVCTGGNPRPCTKALVFKVYEKAYNGK
jgi:lactaldehyde reductase